MVPNYTRSWRPRCRPPPPGGLRGRLRTSVPYRWGRR